MATGDLKNNLRKLIAELKQARFPQDDLDVRGLAHGAPSAFLPIMHYIFLDFSCSLAQYFAGKDYELYGKNDLRFMEVVYRILRDEFRFKPLLTREQFLSIGFAERKILLLSDILKFCRERHKQLNPKRGKTERKAKSVMKVDRNLVGDVNAGKLHGKSKRIVTTEGSRKDDLATEQDINKKNFRSDGEVISVGRESWFENKENMDSVPRSFISDQFAARPKIAFQSNEAPSELIIRTLCSQEGGKFKPLTYTTAASKNDGLSRTKSVTWQDEISTVQEFDEAAEQCMLPRQQRPSPITLAIDQPRTPLSGMRLDDKDLQGTLQSYVPVSWTVAPLPSDDLLLTPSGKSAAHQPIPLSESRGHPTTSGADVSMVDIMQSVNVPHAQVTRHKPSLPSIVQEGFGHDSSSQSILVLSEEICLLKHQFQELQDKFDSVTLHNSEMSARVILLESKVKLLEESSSRSVCSNCSRPLEGTHVPTGAPEVKVVSGFDIQRSTSNSEREEVVNFDSMRDPLYANSHSTSRRLYLETNNHSVENISLQDDPTAEHDSTESNGIQKSTKIVDLPEKSEVSGNPFSVYLLTPRRSEELSLHESDTVLSPLATPEPSLAYVNSTTKATVANVQKRLKETREMLMKTNRDFAKRFDHISQQ